MFKSKQYITLLICLLWCCSIQGQEDSQKIPIVNVLNEITKLHNVNFNYESQLLKGVKVFPLSKGLSFKNKIKNLEQQTSFIFSKISEVVFTIKKAIKVCGYLRDTSQNSISGATINGITNYTVSDDTGYFEINLSSLNELITIRFLGYKTIERETKLFSFNDCVKIIMVQQEEVMNPIVLKSYLVNGIDKRQDGSISIDYQKFTLLPGLIESDVLQTIQALPSILSVDETVSNLNIRGGSHDQNLILWDDIKMYQSGHFFGLISSFNPQITQTATLINNGTDASLTDGVSGTIHMQSNKEIESNFKGTFGVNFLSADFFTNIPLGKKSSLQFAARKSTDDFIRTPTYETYFDRVTQDTEVQDNISETTNSNQAFNFYDTSLRWLYNPTDKDFIRFNFILINNDLNFDETALLNGALETRRSSVSQNSVGFGIHYRRKWNDHLTTVFNIYETDYKLQAINANVLAEQRFLQENIVSETGAKISGLYTQNLWKFKIGYHFIESEVTNLNDVDLPRFLRLKSEVLREHAVFTQAKYENRSKDFSIRSGIRFNYLEKFKKLIIEPRLNIRKTLGSHLEIEALGEIKHQNVSQIINFQNDFLGIEKRRWQLTDNDSIPVIESKQASIGFLYKKKGWLIDTKAYYKRIDGITTQSQSFTTKYEFQREKGSYNVFGIEFLLRKKINKVNSWLSYSYMKNTYTFETLEEIEFPSNFDITHSITLGSTYSNESWNLSAGLNYRIGKPTSIPLLGNEIIDDQINFDIANNSRLEDYFRLDASALYKFKINKTFLSEVGASVWNISNRENLINNYYRIDNDNNPVKFSRFSLGITTNAVFRVFF
tara:strand:- start:3422 stop:5923 length:2502 start_codon:yes stop_codon:yes gene_type:complete